MTLARRIQELERVILHMDKDDPRLEKLERELDVLQHTFDTTYPRHIKDVPATQQEEDDES